MVITASSKWTGLYFNRHAAHNLHRRAIPGLFAGRNDIAIPSAGGGNATRTGSERLGRKPEREYRFVPATDGGLVDGRGASSRSASDRGTFVPEWRELYVRGKM